MKIIKGSIISFLLLVCIQSGFARSGTVFQLLSGQEVTVAISSSEEKVVYIAIDLLKRDLNSVLSASLVTDKKKGEIIVGTLGHSSLLDDTGVDFSELAGEKEAFLITVIPDGRLLIAGSDKRGTAYGVLEISRLLGVSPWEWWADAIPQKRESFYLPVSYRQTQSPSVEYRGIFLNDEDWALLPWSNRTYEPSEHKNHIGPRTYERIFELLLRLRANTLWPAMHESTLPFFLTEGNRQVAADYSIYIGSSHCEPMVCNAAGEWGRRGKGDYDYVNNKKNVYDFWEQRVKEVARQDNIYTLGMRGVHDGKMQGANTIEEQKNVLVQAINDQRNLLTKYVDKDITSVPQVFIPYKEVLDIYNAGLEVPDEVTLMWCDDNYGYIRHFPTAEERARKGGNGVYYHISYWGRPHDYLWLSTMSPSLVYQQMSEAYERGIQKMWILNVGDIKPGEYQIELFMDMAWSLDEVQKTGVTAHQHHFLTREFGRSVADSLLPVMQEYYRLAYIRKPEFMGNTRVEESAPEYKVVKDLPWGESCIRERLSVYGQLSDKVEALFATLPETKQDAYYHLVKYPVQASAQMNRKLLSAQLARHGKMDWAESDAAYDSIATLTQIYNKGINNDGKWNHMMDFRPRKLPVYDRVKQEVASAPLVEDRLPVQVLNGTDYSLSSSRPVLYDGLGYAGKAVGINRGAFLTFDLSVQNADSIEVVINLLPAHPVQDGKLRIAVALNNSSLETISYETKGRSEEWKMNVLRNRAIRRVVLPVSGKNGHSFTLTALDEGVVLDQIEVYILK